MNQFEALGLSPALLKNIETLGYDVPTPIQQKAIPTLLEGRDLMGLAQTGTGKTAAFGLPLVQLLGEDRSRPLPRSVRALILAPTRELANQIAENLRNFVKRSPLRVSVVVGGASMRNQIRDLERGVDILVATPGRLIDHVENRSINISTVKFLVLDEADQMLDLGFIQPLRQIAKLVGAPRQTMLFSATMPKQIEALSRTFLTDPVRVEATPPGSTAERVRQYVHFVQQGGKTALLTRLLSADAANLSLVFARTKHGAEKLMKHLVASGLPAVSIHGNKSQSQRERAIKDFRGGQARILVATDVAARGIDIPGVSHVYNHDLPQVAESYVHRIGRTARAGKSGEAVSFCAPDETKLLRAIERLTGIEIERLNQPVTGQAGQSRNAIEVVEMGRAVDGAGRGGRRGSGGRNGAPRGEQPPASREADRNGRSRRDFRNFASTEEREGHGAKPDRQRQGAAASGAREGRERAAQPAGGRSQEAKGWAKPGASKFSHRGPSGAPGRRNRRPGRKAVNA